MMNKADSTKSHKIYVRRGVTHICFEGSHFAPTGDTKFSTKHPVTRITVLSPTTLEVAQSVNRKKAQVEVWTMVEVPRNHKTSTPEGFQRASFAGLTGWRY